MILHAEERQRLVAHALVGIVVQIDMRDFDFARRQRFRIDAETMILSGDFYLLGQQILYGVIRTVVAEFQLERFAAQRQSAQLVPQANSENRHAADELLNALHSVADRLRIARPVREEDPVRLHPQNVFGGSLRRHNVDFAVVVDKQAQNVLLDAVVVGHHAMSPRFRFGVGFAHLLRPGRERDFYGAFVPSVGLPAGDAAGEFLPSHAGQLLGFENQLFGGRSIRRDNAAQRADVSNVAHQRASVDVPDDRNLVPVQIQLGGFRRSPVGRDLREFPHDERFDVRPRGFLIFEVGADVSDVRVGQTNDLPGIAGVGENFLVTGEAGIENDFAAAAGNRPRRAAVKDAPVFQREYRGSVLNFGQWVLPCFSSSCAIHLVSASVVESEPK